MSTGTAGLAFTLFPFPLSLFRCRHPQVTLSSLNRHCLATRADVGLPKATVLAQHFKGTLAADGHSEASCDCTLCVDALLCMSSGMCWACCYGQARQLAALHATQGQPLLLLCPACPSSHLRLVYLCLCPCLPAFNPPTHVCPLVPVSMPACLPPLRSSFRPADIVPEAAVEARVQMYTGEGEEALLGGGPDFVIDAIDNIDTKVWWWWWWWW
jgi:hypothetical protein